MNFKKSLITLALSSTLSINVNASDTNFGGPDAVENQLKEDQKNGVKAFKESFKKHGVNFSLDYSAIALGATETTEGADDNAASGMVRFYGSWDAYQPTSKNSGSLVWKVEHRHSYTDTSVKDFEFGAGGLGLVTPPFSDQGTRFTNLYWRQKFMDGKGTAVVGFLDVTDYLDVYALASPWTGFMNFAFSTGTTTIALPGDATLGAAAGYMLTDNTYIIGGLADMNSDPKNIWEGFDTFFNDNKYFKSVELGWTKSQSDIYTDNVHLTLWHADESEVQGSTKGWGANFSASRMIDGQWLPFLRAGYSKDAGTLMEKSVSVGFGYFGLGGPQNNLGVAVNWGDVDGGSGQITTEAFYIMKPLQNFEVTADVQYIANPALNADEDTLIYGLRLRAIL